MRSNIASTYSTLGRFEEALRLRRVAYREHLKLNGKEHPSTLVAANSYADSLISLERFEEAKVLLRKTMPVARRVLGESADLTFKMRLMYAAALYDDPAATLDDLSEAVTRLEDAQRIARRVLGAAHPLTAAIERTLRDKRGVLCARETPPPGGAPNGQFSNPT